MMVRPLIVAGLAFMLAARTPAEFATPRPHVRWQYSAPAWGTPAVDAGHVYFMTRDGEVLSLDARTGRQLWRRRIGPADQTPLGSRIVMAGEVAIAGNYDIVALDRESGREQWRFQPPDGYGAGIYLGDARAGRLFTGSPSGRLYALDAASGTRLWSLPVASGARATVFAPVADDDLVVAGFSIFAGRTTGGVIAADARTGAVRWQMSFPESAVLKANSGWAGGPAMAHDMVFAATADGSVYGIDRETGRIRSVVVRGHGSQPDFRAMTLTGGQLMLGSLTGDVAAYGITDRQRRWRVNGDDMGSVGFAIAADRDDVYVPYLGGRLTAIAVADGRERWRTTREQGAFFWVPGADAATVFAAGADSLTAFSR